MTCGSIHAPLHVIYFLLNLVGPFRR
jgi:hypothetical protein